MRESQISKNLIKPNIAPSNNSKNRYIGKESMKKEDPDEDILRERREEKLSKLYKVKE